MSSDRSWNLPENQATDEKSFRARRKILTMMGLGGAAALAGGAAYWLRGSDAQILEAGRQQEPLPETVAVEPPVEDYKPGRPNTDQAAVARHVNYYEFSPVKWGTWRKANVLPVRPWSVVVDGLVKSPKTFDIDDLVKEFGSEQRVYRHRCVETWAMVVPWLGFPLRKLLEKVEPLDSAKYVRFETADVQDLTGIAPPQPFPWPYQEGLTLAEAMNPLAFLATGFYGEAIFKQNGAPIRLVVPWKYGFKSIKSIIRIELVDTQPATFWNVASPDEYGFYANVNPEVDHPRWSQKTEWMIDTKERFPTKLYNGYGEWVADLYTGNEV